jgi:AAA15 family ATPase/GTPase
VRLTHEALEACLKEFDCNNLETIPENIAKLYQDLDNKANRQAIINHFRMLDESHLYPINSKFNATKKAIKALSEFEDEYGDELLGLELALFLDAKISEIVNDPELV